MEKISGVIWDLDGVLVDTGEFHYIAWAETLSSYNIPFTRETFKKTFGMNNEGILRYLLDDKYSDEICNTISEEKERNFRHTIRGKVKTLPGAVHLLTQIEHASIPQAIGSSAPRANIDTIVSELGIDHFFKATVSAAEMPGKPDPTVFLTAAKLLEANPEFCIVIEDAIAGIQAAHRAGMKCIAITTTHDISHLKAADLTIERLDEITLDKLQALLDRSTVIKFR